MKNFSLLLILPILFILVSTTVTSTQSLAAKAKIKPTPTPIPVCLAEIVYAVNAKEKKCQSFSSTCFVPKNWTIVDECPAPTPTKTPKRDR